MRDGKDWVETDEAFNDFCSSVMRDTNPPGLYVCELEEGHTGPHKCPTIEGGWAMWTEGGAVLQKKKAR
jgi:hypothetical protein